MDDRHHRAIYDWADWFSQTDLWLYRNVDYFCTPHGMVSQIRKRAKKYHKAVSIQVCPNDAIHVLIQELN